MNDFLCNNNNIKNLLTMLYEGVYFVDKDRLVTYWSPGAEKITGYKSSDITGKQQCNRFLLHVDFNGEALCNTACPIIASLSEGKICEAEVYLHHSEGHRIPVSVRTFPIYDFQNNIAGAIQVFHDNSPKSFHAKELAELQNMATIDELTGLRNRRYAEKKINALLSDVKAGEPKFGFLFVDIDHFKRVNDTFGHNIGDLVLKMVGKTLLSNTQERDILVRWGGEEIVIVIMSTNVERKIYKIANKLRNLIGQSILTLDDGHTIQVTVSIGATVGFTSDTLDTLVERADKLMYQCKNEGRNCVKIEL